MPVGSVPRGAALFILCAALLAGAQPPAFPAEVPLPLNQPPRIPGLRVVGDYGRMCLRFPPITVQSSEKGGQILLLTSCHQGQLKDYPSPAAPPSANGDGGENALRWERLARACGNFNLVAALDGGTRKLRWKFAAGGLVESTFLASGGRRLIFFSTDDTVYDLDVSTGKLIWKSALSPGIEAMAVNDSAVVAVTSGNVAVGLSPSDGKTLWRLPVKVPSTGRPWGWLRLKEGTVYLASMDNRVVALDAKSGKVRWTVRTDASPGIRRTRGDDLIVTAGNTILALAMDTGAVRWRRELKSVSAAGPVIDAGPVFITSGADRLGGQRVFGLDPATGRLRWARKIGEAAPMRTGSTVSVPEDAIPVPVLQLLPSAKGGAPLLIETDRHGVRAVEPKTGKLLWNLQAKLPWRVWVEAGRLFITHDSAGEAVLCLDARTGKKLWERTTPSRVHQLELVDGYVLITLWEKQLLVLSQADGKQLGWYEMGDPYRILEGEGGRVIICSEWGSWELESEDPPPPNGIGSTEVQASHPRTRGQGSQREAGSAAASPKT